jgi:hypothetical protein
MFPVFTKYQVSYTPDGRLIVIATHQPNQMYRLLVRIIRIETVIINN